MGHKKEVEQSGVAVRICPECARAFFSLDSENVTCVFCGTPVTEFGWS